MKKALCERHKADYGTDYSAAECVVTVGGKHVIFNLAQVLLNAGDEVVIPVPYWVTYKDVVNYTGAKCVFVPTDEDKGFTLTASMIEPHLNSKTKMVIINSPSNPSGGVLDRIEFERILHMTQKRGIWLMTDECYCRFLYDDEPYSIATKKGAKDTLLVAGSLSKTYAMTGWRIGFGLGPAAVMSAINKLQSHSTSNPTSIAQKAAVEAVRGPQDSIPVMLAEYRKRRDFVIDRLRQIPGVKIGVPKGAFYAYPSTSAWRWAKAAYGLQCSSPKNPPKKAHVAVVPGEAFGTEEHIRISYATSHGRAEARSRPPPSVHRKPGVIRRLQPKFVERIWGNFEAFAVVPRLYGQDRRSLVHAGRRLSSFVQVPLHFREAFRSGSSGGRLCTNAPCGIARENLTVACSGRGT